MKTNAPECCPRNRRPSRQLIGTLSHSHASNLRQQAAVGNNSTLFCRTVMPQVPANKGAATIIELLPPYTSLVMLYSTYPITANYRAYSFLASKWLFSASLRTIEG